MKKIMLLFIPLLLFSNEFATSNISLLKKHTFRDQKSGKLIDEITVPGIPKNKRVSGPIAQPNRSSVIINNVPAFNWSFGCSATSAAMMSGYYDNDGYPANYSGETNNSVMPQDNSSWPDWNDGYDNRHQCPLSATHNNLDGKTTDGHVDRFWKRYGKSANNGAEYADTFTGDPTGTYQDCTADFMGTNQDWWNNIDGSTTFFYRNDGSPTENYSGSENSDPRRRDGIRGLRLFFESRGYTVVSNYNQYIKEEGKTYGFSFQDFENEIDSNRPVLIQVAGHTMLGIGYDPADSTVYVHDTWDYNTHTMKWGGSYSGMHHYGVSVIQLEPKQTTTSPIFSPLGGTFTASQNIEISLNSQPNSGVTTIRYSTDGNEPTENSSLYSDPINIPLNTNITIIAKSFNDLWESAESSSQTYNITGKIDTPIITPSDNIYYSKINCTISCSNPNNVDIYYTVDGSNPIVGNSSTQHYTTSFELDSDAVVKAIGTKTDWEDSNVAIANYTIEPSAPTPNSPSNNETDVSYETFLHWTSPSDGATPDFYKVAISTSNPPSNFVNVGDVLKWKPSPHLNWNDTYYWQVIACTNDSKGDGQKSDIYSFTVSDGDTSNGNGDNGGSGNVDVNLNPIKIDNKPITPEVQINTSNNLSVTIVVDDAPQNPGLSDPNDVSLSYSVDFNGSGTMDFVMYFSGLASIGIQPNKLMYYNGSNWNEIQSPTWDYDNEKVSFTLNIGGRASNEFVLNNNSSTLPVELSSFSVINENDSAKILWVTESETDVLGFNIFRSNTTNENNSVKLNSELINPSNSSSQNQYSFTDNNIEIDNTYYYWLEEINNSGNSNLSDYIKFDFYHDESQNNSPEEQQKFGISLIYPNPFNPSTTINYNLKSPANVKIDIFNIKGEKVYSIDEGYRKSDTKYSVCWNGETFSKTVSSGVYFIHLKAKNLSQFKRVVLIK